MAGIMGPLHADDIIKKKEHQIIRLIFFLVGDHKVY